MSVLRRFRTLLVGFVLSKTNLSWCNYLLGALGLEISFDGDGDG